MTYVQSVGNAQFVISASLFNVGAVPFPTPGKHCFLNGPDVLKRKPSKEFLIGRGHWVKLELHPAAIDFDASTSLCVNQRDWDEGIHVEDGGREGRGREPK